MLNRVSQALFCADRAEYEAKRLDVTFERLPTVQTAHQFYAGSYHKTVSVQD